MDMRAGQVRVTHSVVGPAGFPKASTGSALGSRAEVTHSVVRLFLEEGWGVR